MSTPALENSAINFNQEPIVLEPSNSQQGVSGSAYASMASAIFMIASMMSYLNTSYSKMSQIQTQEQNTFTTQLRHATVQEGQKQANQYWTQMGMSIGQAVGTVGGMAYGAMGNSEVNTQLEQTTQDMNDLKALRPDVAAGVKEAQENAGIKMADPSDPSSVFSDPETPEQMQLRQNLENGLFKGQTPGDGVQAAVKSSEGKAPEILKELDQQIAAKQSTIDSLNGQISNQWRKGEMGGQLFKEVVNAAGQGVQAHFVKAAAEWKAIGQAAQYNQGLSAQTTQSIQKTMSDFYSYLNSVLSTLGQVAASVSG